MTDDDKTAGAEASSVLEYLVDAARFSLPYGEALAENLAGAGRDNALGAIHRLLHGRPGSAVFVRYVSASHELCLTPSRPSPPFVYAIKTRARAQARACLAWGTRSSDDILAFAGDLLEHVFVPYADGRGSDTPAAPKLRQFSKVLSREIQSRQGKLELQIPTFPTAAGAPMWEHRPEHLEVQELDACVQQWLQASTAFLAAENSKVPLGRGPLGEVRFWKARHLSLSGAYEQINGDPHVKGSVARLIEAQKDSGIKFSEMQTDLGKLYAEAKDNVKFLSTLERYLKVVHHGTFREILETIPALLNALRMMWIVSRHYNTDEKIVPLMERIADEMTRRIAVEVRVTTLLDKPSLEARTAAQVTIGECVEMLNGWESIYLAVRDRVNDSLSTTAPWEFDRRRLFGKSRYMATVLEDLKGVITTIEQFLQFLGPVKSIVSKRAAEVDGILLSVEVLKQPFAELRFEAFDRSNRERWREVMEQFDASVKDNEEVCKVFIENSFQELTSAEAAFDLVTSFERIESRPSINAHVAGRFQDILHRYNDELSELIRLFQCGKSDPPKVKECPPVASAVAWATSLYKRAKRMVLRFKARSGLLESPFGLKLKHRYLAFARDVDVYVNGLHEGWASKAEAVIAKLKEPLLKAVHPPDPKLVAQLRTKAPSLDAGLFVMPPPPFVVTFGSDSGDALEIINEARCLDSMGFGIPAGAVSITLQSNQLQQFALGLESMLKRLHSAINELTTVEEELLADHRERLLNVLEPGLTTYNWRSQRIPAYTAACQLAITQFCGVVDAVHSNGASIQRILDGIAATALITPRDLLVRHPYSPGPSGQVERPSEAGATSTPATKAPMSLVSFVDFVEHHKKRRLDELARGFSSITPLLLKVEEEVASTNTGSSMLLKSYYCYWEAKSHNAITTMVVRSLATLLAILDDSEGHETLLKDSGLPISAEALLSSAEKARKEAAAALERHRRAASGGGVGEYLLLLQASFSGADLLVTPSLQSILKTMTTVTKSMVEAARMFPRWMYDHQRQCGTCLEAPAVIVNEDEDPVVISHYNGIHKNEVVIALMLRLRSFVHTAVQTADKWLDSWRVYAAEPHSLWTTKKKGILAKVRKEQPGVVFFDRILTDFRSAADAVRARPAVVECSFLHIDSRAAVRNILEALGSWQADYLSIMQAGAKVKLSAVREKLRRQRDECIGTETSNLEQLKVVLNAVARIERQQMENEIEALEIGELYRTLYVHSHGTSSEVEPQERELAAGLCAESRQLFIDAKTRDLRLVDTKETFKLVTQQQTADFTEEMASMRREYLDGGPGISGDLNLGLASLAIYQDRAADYMRQKAELVNAQTLFGLAIASFPDLAAVQSDLERLSRIYALYQEQKSFQDSCSSTLWGDLDISTLQEGAEIIEKKCRRFPEELKAISIFKDVKHAIDDFRESLPLIVALKNDAMLPRHWSKVMEVTGVVFEYNPSTLTLEAIFNMSLARYQEQIEEIVNEAVQEAKIATEIRKIESAWGSIDLVLEPYVKDGKDRGFTLIPKEETKVFLEDNLLK